MTTYKGFSVLDQVPHNMRESIAEAFGRQGTLLANALGKPTWDDHAGVALPRRSFQWTARNRTECNALRAFLDERRGRLVPFWTPTFAWDLPLAIDVPGNATLTVQSSGYATYLFPSLSRRDLCIVIPRQPFILRRALSATTVGANDVVTLDAAVGVAGAAAVTRVTLLVLCRLAEDFVSILWHGTDCCEASIPFVELPREVPA